MAPCSERSGPGHVPGRRPAAPARVLITATALPWPMTTCDIRRRPKRLSAWRRTRLVALGVPEDVALVHAEDAFSVHELTRLRAQGCPLGTALRILWPA
jgi:hypothetical protein